MGRQKGQGIVEYALILAFVVGIGGVLFANGNLADSIRSVFSNVNTLIEEASKQPLKAATTAEDIIDRLGEGRYKNLADLLQGKPSSGKKIIASDSEEGKELARKLNIQTKEGDGWFADIDMIPLDRTVKKQTVLSGGIIMPHKEKYPMDLQSKCNSS